VPAFDDKDICRLNVAVDDTCAVGGIESVGNLYRQTEERLNL